MKNLVAFACLFFPVIMYAQVSEELLQRIHEKEVMSQYKNLTSHNKQPLGDPEQDCNSAIPVCQTTFTQPNSYVGYGNQQEVPSSSCLGSQEKNSVWYIFTVQTTGTLQFQINPVSASDDYDYALYNLTGTNCTAIPNGSAPEASCNFSATPGTTGLSSSGTGNSQPASGTNQNALLNVTVGQTYVLIVSNYSSTQSGYSLSFAGGTASIFDTTPPAPQSVFAPCGQSNLTLQMTEAVTCASIAANGSDLTLTGPGGPFTISSVSGTNCGTSSSQLQVNFSPSLTTGATYNLAVNTGSDGNTLIDNCGNACVVGSSINFTVSNPPASISGNNTLCKGSSTTLTATNGTAYSWSPGGATTQSIVVSPTTNTTYTCTVTNGTCGSSSASISVSVQQSPTANFTMTPNPACVGQVVTFTNTSTLPCSTGGLGFAQCTCGSFLCQPTNASLGIYTWTFGTGGLGGFDTGQNVTYTYSATGTYTVNLFVTDLFSGCSNDISQTITVLPGAGPLTASNDTTICPGQSANISANGGSSYNWTSTPAGFTSSAQSFTVSPATTTTYNVSSPGCSSALTESVVVTVSSGIINTSAITGPATACAGSTGNVYSVTNTAGSTYNWTVPAGSSITGGQGSNSITVTLGATGGNITVTESNSCGPGSPVTFAVNIVSTLTITVSPPASSLCAGGNVSLTASGALNYVWSPGTGLSGTSGATVTATPVSTETYTVNGTSGTCAGSTTVTITINPLPAMTSAASATICSGGPVNIPLTSDISSTYSWIAADNTNTTGESSIAQTTGTLNNTIINNSTTVQTVTYTVTPTSTAGTCIGSPQTVTVTVNPTPAMTSAATTAICSGDVVSIPFTSNVASTYTWIAADNANTTGESLTGQTTGTLNNTLINNSTSVQTVTYTVTPTSTVGSCAGTPQTVAITVNPNPTMTSATSATICSGSVVNIPLTSDIVSSFSWIATDNANTTGESITTQTTGTLNNTITNNSITVQTITYTVSPTSTVGTCVGTTQTILVTVNPEPTMTSATTATICSGAAVNISLTSDIPSTYSWIAADNTTTTGESLSAQTTSTLNNTITNNSSTVQTITYTVTPTSTVGTCSGTPQTVTVTVNPAPIMISASVATICSGGTVSVTLASDVPSAYSWMATDNTNTSGESLTAQTTATLSNTITNNSIASQIINYTVTPTSTVGSCTGTPQLVTIAVNPAPTITSTASTTICSGGTVNIALTSDIASTYNWIATDNSNTTGESLTTQTTSTLNNTITNSNSIVETVTYTITPTSTIGTCIGTPQIVDVDINPMPAMTSASTATVCSGAAVNIPLTSNVTSTYSWIATDNTNTTGESLMAQTTSTLNNTIVNNSSAIQTVTYNVSPTSSAGSCIGIPQTITVTVNPSPNMTNATTATICSGTSVNIILTSDVASTFSWIAADNANTSGESLATQTTSTLNNTITNNSNSSQIVTYSVIPTSTVGACVGLPQTISVTVNPAPLMTSASIATTCSGTAVNIVLTSDIASTYSWIATDNSNTAGESLSAQTTSTLNNTIINNTNTMQTVNYAVTPTSTTGSCMGAPQTITITVNPLPTMTSAATGTICSGGTLNIPLTSDIASTYSWMATDNTNTTGESLTAQLTGILNNTIINNSIAVQTVIYTVNPTATVGTCIGLPQTVTITLNPSPAMTSATSATTCSGIAVNIPLSSTIASAYSWVATDNANTTGESLTTQTTSTINNTITNNTNATQMVTYSVTPTSTVGSCVGLPQTVTATINPKPAMSNPSAATICSADVLSIPLTSIVASTYTWIATDNTNTTGESLTTQTTSTLSNTITNTTATAQAVSYAVTPTSTGGSCIGIPQIFTVTVNPNPTINVTPLSTTSCAGNPSTLTASGSSTSYSWAPGTGLSSTTGTSVTATPPATTTYTVTGTLNGCTDSAVAVIQVTPVPVVTFNIAGGTTICQGNSLVLSATGGATSYTWSPSATLSSAFGISVTATPGITTTYYATDTTGGCLVTEPVTVTVIPPIIVTTAANNDTICIGQTSHLSSTGGDTYSWVPSSSLDNSTIANPIAFPTSTTLYTLTASSNGLCPSTGSVTVYVNPLPFAYAGYDTTINNDYFLMLNGSGTGSLFWTETSSTLTCLTCPNPIVNPHTNTSYFLTVTDAFGCKNTDTVFITVTDFYALFIPTAFTPDDDGLNDVFMAEGFGLKSISMKIFNRWGEKIFETSKLGAGWDGTFKGRLVEQDVYVYKISATPIIGSTINRTGSVTVVR